VEGHDVAVDRHQAEHPGSADEEQQEEGHSKGRTEEGGKARGSASSPRAKRATLLINLCCIGLRT